MANLQTGLSCLEEFLREHLIRASSEAYEKLLNSPAFIRGDSYIDTERPNNLRLVVDNTNKSNEG